jgi:hypothetical protein
MKYIHMVETLTEIAASGRKIKGLEVCVKVRPQAGTTREIGGGGGAGGGGKQGTGS